MSELNEVANRVHDQVAGINRVTLFPATSLRRIDAASSSTIYVGVAAAGSSNSLENGWLIERISVSGTDVTIEHATGNWTNRSSLTYS